MENFFIVNPMAAMGSALTEWTEHAKDPIVSAWACSESPAHAARLAQEAVAYGAEQGNETESNAVQLWSAAVLAVRWAARRRDKVDRSLT